MINNSKSKIAEVVGYRVLQWKGSEFLELIYMLEEKNALKFLRLLAEMNVSSQDKLIEFMKCVSQRDNIKLRVDHSGLHIEEE